VFLAFLTIQYGRFFILVLLIEKKLEQSHPQKRPNSGGGSNWHIFWYQFFLFLSITSFKIIQIQNVGSVSENSGNLQQDEHKNFQNWLRNAWDNGTQSWQPQKLKQQKLSQFEPTLKSCFFCGWDFSTFFSIICPKITRMKNHQTCQLWQPALGPHDAQMCSDFNRWETLTHTANRP